MSFLESIAFAIKFALGIFTLTSLVLPLVVFLFSFLLVGGGWGKLWNKKWGIGSLPIAAVSFVIALLLALTTLGYRAVSQASSWIEHLRPVISDKLTGSNSGSLNRKILRDAWSELKPRGGQQDLPDPDDGGNEIRLNDEEEARTLARIAAEAAKPSLQSERFFQIGVPVQTGNIEDVVSEVIESVQRPDYPITVSPDNIWTRNALAKQATTALDNAVKWLKQPADALKSRLSQLGIAVLLIQIVFVAFSAYNDIKENPKA